MNKLPSAAAFTVFPSDLAEMSVCQLASLLPEQKHQIALNLAELGNWLKQANSKFDTALEYSYGERARIVLRDSDRDFGTTHLNDGALKITYVLPKKVTWDQEQLAAIAARISESGEKVSDYIDFKFSVSESHYTNWPPALQAQFTEARTAEPCKPSFTLTFDAGDAP
jgi:hypothetical protein